MGRTEPSSAGDPDRKGALRARMREARAALSATERDELARRIEGRLLRLEEVRAARTVMAFASFGAEVPTASIVARLLEEGRRVLLPYLDDGRVMRAGEVRPGEELVRSGYGPREPPGRAFVDPLEIDVVLVPGLAFDRAGRRLGYGGGNYDRFLPALRAEAWRVGLAFGLQIVEAVPAEPGDELLDAVVTEREVIRTGRARS